MKEVKYCIPIEIKSGSGLALAATVTTMGDTTIKSKIETMTDSTDLTASISTIIDLAVV